MPKFAAGVLDFQSNVYPSKQSLFEKLSGGQSPEALFITCADSRIDTAMITHTEPGELFVCRNAGNIVPPHADNTDGLDASIEYALSALKIPNIVICGHSGCGAMAGAMNPEGLDSLPKVKDWLSHSKEAVDKVHAIGADKTADEKMDMLIEQNVLLQIQHLKTHPSVAAALAEKRTEIHGWVYNIGSGKSRINLCWLMSAMQMLLLVTPHILTKLNF